MLWRESRHATAAANWSDLKRVKSWREGKEESLTSKHLPKHENIKNIPIIRTAPAIIFNAHSSTHFFHYADTLQQHQRFRDSKNIPT